MNDGRESVSKGYKVNMVADHSPRLNRLRDRDDVDQAGTAPTVGVRWFYYGSGGGGYDNTNTPRRCGCGCPLLETKEKDDKSDHYCQIQIKKKILRTA
jgi:hypothetical protein